MASEGTRRSFPSALIYCRHSNFVSMEHIRLRTVLVVKKEN
jgi:hypothetical protein